MCGGHLTRALTSDYLDELEASNVKIAFFYEGEFSSGTIRLWTGVGNIDWDSKTWLGNSWFQGWSGVGETSEIKAVSMDITLAGVPQDVLALVLNEASQNKMGRLYLAFLDADEEVIADPYLLFEGKLDYPEINDSAESATVVISYESELIELETAEEFRYTDINQKSFYPSDKGLEYITSLSVWDGFWGFPEVKDRKNPKKKKKQKPKRKRRK